MKLTNTEKLQKIVGKLPAPRDLKVIDHIDEHAMRWLSYANFADEHLLKQFEVQGKKPKLITKITPTSMRIKPSQVIDTSALWPAKKAPEDLVPSEIFKAHIKQSKERSLQAKIARAAVSLPGAMEKGLELDYKSNLY